MTAFGSIYYARKFVDTLGIKNPMISRCQDRLFRIFVDTGFLVDATRTTCANINSRFGKSLRFRLDRVTKSYQILAPYDDLENIQTKLSIYKGEGCNCIWQEKRIIKYGVNG